MTKKIGDFQNYQKFIEDRILMETNICNFDHSLWSREVPQKIWARSVQPFWRLMDTSKQTDKLNLYIDMIV